MEENKYNLIIGSHVRMGAPLYFLGSVIEAISYNSNTFMFYTGAPQNLKRVDTNLCKIEDAKTTMQSNNIDISNVICHAPYLINLGNISNKNTYEFSKELLIKEITRCDDFGCKTLVLHPGACLNEDRLKSHEALIEGLNYVISKTKNVVIAIETMSGKGSEIGTNFDEIAYIINKIEDKSRIGVCLDTCHINDAGYDLNNFDSVLGEFIDKIGLNYLKVIHVNDSKNPINSHKDRHENIGFGTIGFDNLLKIIYHPLLNGIPKILETPYVNKKPPYKEEILMIKSKVFNKDLFKNY